MPFGGIQVRSIGQAVSQLARRLYQAPPDTIAGVNSGNWPTAGQPVAPFVPNGQPLINPYWFGQNYTYTPRPDAVYTASELRGLSMFPLARICIDNAKDMICKMSWVIQLRQMPGETDADVVARRKAAKKGDPVIKSLSKFFDSPNPEQDWSEWLRQVLEDMLTIDAASIFMDRTANGKVAACWRVPGEFITRYVDDGGRTPLAPNPAYAQLWEGIPRVDLTTNQLIYKPRNIVPRTGIISSYYYGCSPTEALADEIKIGIARLMFVLAYYERGSVGNMIHVAPPRIPPDKVEEAVRLFNAQVSGNLGKRRQYNVIQGFQDEGKQEQIIFPSEPSMADVFDDLLIRKIAFGFGNSPQRLLKPMNRGSAQVSQQAANEEGIRPWMDWVIKLVNFIIQRKFGMEEYEIDLKPDFDTDPTKRQKADASDVNEGIRTRNEVRESRGLDPIDDPMASQLCITTANGVVRLGDVVTAGNQGPGQVPTKQKDSSLEPKPPAQKVNGRLIERGER